MAFTKRQQARKDVRKSSVDSWVKNQKFDFDSKLYKLPKGMKKIKLEEGIRRLDVIPYVAGKDNPSADEGCEHWERTIGVRRGLGVDGKDSYVCPSRYTFSESKPDFIEDWIADNKGTAGKYIETLKVQRRILMFVKDVTDTEPYKAPTGFLDESYGSKDHPGLGQQIYNKMVMSKKYRDFSDLKNGFTLVCQVEMSQPPGFKKPFPKIVALEMEEREYEYDDEERDNLPSLESLLIVPSYDEMKEIFLKGSPKSQEDDEEDDQEDETEDQDEEEEEEEEEKPAKGKKRSTEEVTADDVGLEVGDIVNYHFTDEEDDEQDVECEIKKISGDGTSLTLEDEDGNTYKGVGVEEVAKVKTAEDEEEEEEESEPSPTKKKITKKDSDDEDEDPFKDSEDTDEDEEE